MFQYVRAWMQRNQTLLARVACNAQGGYLCHRAGYAEESLLHAKKFGNFLFKLLNEFAFAICVVGDVVTFAPFCHCRKSLGRCVLEMTS